MPDVLTIAGISQEAKTYQPQLRTLPYFVLAPELAKVGIQLMEVAGIDVMTQMLRKGGLLKPYDPANLDYSADFLRFKERSLETKKSVISMKDFILNYQGKKLLNKPMAGDAQNQTKEHPFKNLITSNVVITAAEDILDAMFFSEYNIAVRNPLGCFDGFNTKIDALITAVEIAAASGNRFNTGAIVAPINDADTIAIKQVVDFVRAADTFLKKRGVLMLTQSTYMHLVDSLENKMKSKQWDLNAVQLYLNEKAQANVTIVVSHMFGTGDRMILTVPGNFHFGMDTTTDKEFIQVRAPYEDPNIMQFWLQAGFGTRIASVHKKEFLINDGTAVGASMAGDYSA